MSATYSIALHCSRGKIKIDCIDLEVYGEEVPALHIDEISFFASRAQLQELHAVLDRYLEDRGLLPDSADASDRLLAEPPDETPGDSRRIAETLANA